MLASDSRVALNAGEVAAKVIDGEAIIMNLSTGMYYSMERQSAVVWEWLERGHTVAEAAEALAARYDVTPEQARADVEQLVQQVLQEGLVQLERDDASARESLNGFAGEREAYTPLQLNRYGDMADLLALDPPMPTLAEAPWEQSGDRQ
jgi:Coenzyme PQQ synthesis protein D (PqqD)